LSKDKKIPLGFSLDLSRSRVGFGKDVFQSAREAFLRWTMFDLGWVRVADPQAAIQPGQIVAVEAHTLGMWSLNLCRILEVADTPTRFGFLYAATQKHVERGEERFLLEHDLNNDEVRYEIEALSRPRSVLAVLGFPITRKFQHKFARDSHRKLYAEVNASSRSASR
jgi:uncharacterized protein (UPF0548 family)